MTNPADSAKQNAANPMWGGHYERAPDQWMQIINASIDFDHTLYQQDIRGSLAHAAMLKKIGLLTAEEEAQISNGLRQIEGEIARGEMTWRIELEDIHMHVEHRLKEHAQELRTAAKRGKTCRTWFLWRCCPKAGMPKT